MSEPASRDRYLNDAQHALIQDRLKARLSQGCPRCRHSEFNIEDGVFLLPLSRRIDETTTPTRALPSIVTSCNKCGFISMHALGSLGLMNEPSFFVNGVVDEHR